jgi:AcrR family transcriptional regulator
MSSEARKEEQRKLKEKDIIDAAEKLFFEKGIAVTTMDEVSALADLSKRTLYQCFSSKEELILAVGIRGFKLLRRTMETALEVATLKNGLARLKKAAEAYVRFGLEHPGYFRIISEYEPGKQDFESVSVYIRENYEEGEKALMPLFEAVGSGIADGSLKKDLNPVTTALSLWTALSGVLDIGMRKNLYLEQYHRTSAETLCKTAVSLIINAVKR